MFETSFSAVDTIMLNTLRGVIILLFLFQFSVKGMAKKRVAGMVIFRQLDQNIEYLMLKPSKDGKDWSPPKGRLDEGEDGYTAALRETQEEVGYTIDDLDIYRDQQMTVNQIMKNGKKKEVTFWLARLKTPNKTPVLSHEHNEYHWVNKAEASSLYGSDGAFADMFTQFDNKIKTNLLV